MTWDDVGLRASGISTPSADFIKYLQTPHCSNLFNYISNYIFSLCNHYLRHMFDISPQFSTYLHISLNHDLHNSSHLTSVRCCRVCQLDPWLVKTEEGRAGKPEAEQVDDVLAERSESHDFGARIEHFGFAAFAAFCRSDFV